MKALPILMSGPMVAALPQKTQTRRLNGLAEINRDPDAFASARLSILDGWEFNKRIGYGVINVRCPYAVGMLLWVRETFCAPEGLEARNIIYRAGWEMAAASDFLRRKFPELAKAYPNGRWRPSIHMPRWASRWTLRVTGVRCERVQDISFEDVAAEGVKLPRPYVGVDYNDGSAIEHEHIDKEPDWFFAQVWDSLNAKRGMGWGFNPWVWVVEFEAMNRNVDEILREAA